MSEYQALYRKWRPKTFDEIFGQEHISKTLKNAVKSGRVAHAYLFCGTRGTGKTSTAKILARAVNCRDSIDGEPCNKCDACCGILDGSIPDVYEIDAASNNGVDSIREIRDEAIYMPAGCSHKVYIIDEVHMLSQAAFNALLKTLEEPPSHVIFILATTEPQKVPATILSRCQRFDFRRITAATIAQRLNQIALAEGIPADGEAVNLIAELGDGSMRDALSLLDRCAAFGIEKLTVGDVVDIIGIADPRIIFDITDFIAAGSTARALSKTDELLDMGKEAVTLIEDFIKHFRNLLLCKAGDGCAALIDKTAEAAQRYKAQSETLSLEQIISSISALSASLLEAKRMQNPRIAAETAVVKLCSPGYMSGQDALISRIEKLERALAAGTSAPPQPPKTAPKTNDSEDSPPWNTSGNSSPATKTAESKEEINQSEPVKTSTEGWPLWQDALDIIKTDSKALYAFMYDASAAENGDEIVISLGNDFAYKKIATPGGIDYLSKLFSQIGGRPLRANVIIAGEEPEKTSAQGASIMDIVGKKDLLGDKMIIEKGVD